MGQPPGRRARGPAQADPEAVGGDLALSAASGGAGAAAVGRCNPTDQPLTAIMLGTTITRRGELTMTPRTDDPTMELMRQTAEHLGAPPALPPSPASTGPS